MAPTPAVFSVLLLLPLLAESSFISDIDRSARQCFDSKIITPGYVSAGETCGTEQDATDALRQAVLHAGDFAETNDSTVELLGATTWSYSQAELFNHPNGFLLDSSSLELSYIYADSIGLVPVTMRVYRRGDTFWKTPGTESIAIARQSKESFLRIILERASRARGGARPLLAGNELEGASVLGSPDLGKVIADCRNNELAVENDVSGRAFARVKRRNCLVNVNSWADDAECSLNTLACKEECEEPPEEDAEYRLCCVGNECCEGDPYTYYNPKTRCAWVTFGFHELKSDKTLQNLLSERKYFADPIEGTGFDLQSVIPLVRTREDRNGPGAEEATRQAGGYTEASASIINQLAVDMDEAVRGRPTPIDLTLVVAAQLAGAMAVDGGKILRFFVDYGKRGLPREDPSSAGYRWTLLGLASFVAFLTTVPGLLAAIVIIYLEVQHSNLGWRQTKTGWFFTDMYPETTGERVWHVRRVMADALGTTVHSVRPIYIFLPVAMTIFEFGVEATLTARVVRNRLARLKDRQLLSSSGSP